MITVTCLTRILLHCFRVCNTVVNQLIYVMLKQLLSCVEFVRLMFCRVMLYIVQYILWQF